MIIEKQKDKGIKKIYLYGNQDEVYNILRMAVSDIIGMLEIEYELIDDFDAILREEKYILLIWNEEEEEKLKEKEIPYINILSVI